MVAVCSGKVGADALTSNRLLPYNSAFALIIVLADSDIQLSLKRLQAQLEIQVTDSIFSCAALKLPVNVYCCKASCNMEPKLLALQLFAGVVKVTTFEEPARDTFLEAGRPTCDVRIYPAGLSSHLACKHQRS